MTVDILLNTIELIRDSDKHIKTIYLNGGCYKFYLVLETIVDHDCMPMINEERNHIVLKYKNRFFDITGEVFGEFNMLSEKDETLVESWNFSNSRVLTTDCSVCHNPIQVAE